MPRIVRLGRPANDNFRQPGWLTRAVVLGLAALLLTFVLAPAAHAVPVSFGSLSSNDDGSTQVIVDSLNSLEWLRWDILETLTYAQTIDAITTGAYQGWSIAHNSEGQMFVNALLGLHACTVSNGTECGTLNGDLTALLGDSYFDGAGNAAWFLSDNGVDQEAGYIYHSAFAQLVKYNEAGPISAADLLASSADPFGWLLYRPMTQVPEPGTLLLLTGGIAALVFVRKGRRLASTNA